jgi:pyrroline-5-carboxylate reductase
MAVKLLVVGGGKMGSALVTGLIGSGWAEATSLGVVEPVPGRRAALAGEHPGLVTLEAPAPDVLAPGGGAVLAVKPDQAEGACRLLGLVGVTRILSIVAGMAAQRLEATLPDGSVVVRAMPNTPALVGAGMSVIAGGSHARAGDLDWAEDVLSSVGKVVRLPERHLHAVTGLSGSGPAYIFLVVEALVEAGVLVGLPRDVSETLVAQTLLGSARLLEATGEPPGELRSAATSPGGTTAAGLRALEARGVRSAFLEAVATATERSHQLGR